VSEPVLREEAPGSREPLVRVEPLLRVEALTKHFPVTRGVLGRVVGQVRAVDGVSFEIAPGETLGLVGESGCGKTTVGRSVLRLIEPSGGKVTFDGQDITHASPAELTKSRRNLQIIFQDPYSSLNPRLRVADIVGEALEVHGIAKGVEVDRRVADLLRKVGLSPSWMNRYPHEFSGGQRQRIGVARAIALDPKLIVCDEAVSALDVSIQAQVINLLIQLRREMNLAYLFIAHDLSVVRHVSHRIAVMYLGQIVELGGAKRLFAAPAHPYTRALLASIPVPVPRREPRRLILHGDVPSPSNPPSGCRFHTRCPAVMDRCHAEEPEAVTVEPGHTVKCFHAYDLDLGPGEDWYRQVDARIEERTTRNLAAVARTETTSPPRKLRTDAPAKRPREVASPRASRAGDLTPTPRRTGTLLLCVVLALGLLVGLSRFRARRTALRQLAELTSEITARQKLTRSYPENLEELGWRLYPIFDRGRAIDPWGHEVRYRAPGSAGRPFDVWSLGPDGVPSRDDLGQVPTD
jgi:oligopeptide/dipeptide ABC transporter ATP-binding protein